MITTKKTEFSSTYDTEGEFPGSSVFRTPPHFHRQGLEFSPDWGTGIQQVTTVQPKKVTLKCTFS